MYNVATSTMWWHCSN